MTTADGPAPVILGDRYVLVEQVSTSPNNEVWRAHDDLISRTVAVKMFTGPETDDPSWLRNFAKAAKRLAALSHPGLAKVHEHGESDDHPWLAMAWVDGEPLSHRLTTRPPLSAAAGLDLVGQTALALKAAHDAGVTHGSLTTDNVVIRADNVVALLGFAIVTDATRSDDLRAIGGIAQAALSGELASTADLRADVRDFLDWLTNPDHRKPPTDAGDIGRTALALAAALGGTHATSVVPAAKATTPEKGWRTVETPLETTERKRVRNRLIILGAIVVIGGGGLLRFIGEGGGQVVVPNEIGKQVDQAKLDLTQAALTVKETDAFDVTDSASTVTAQSPAAGTRVKAGSAVTLTITEGAG